MADFHAKKHYDMTSDSQYIVTHPNTGQPNLTSPNPPISSQKVKSEGFTVRVMAKLKQFFNWPTVQMKRISHSYIQKYVAPIVNHMKIS